MFDFVLNVIIQYLMSSICIARTKESCILLNLLPGSAALLQEVLVMSTKKSKKDQTASEATKALLDIGVNGISPEIALRILNSRVDWPRIQ